MQKMKYEIDPYNRLVAESTGKKSSLLKFRRVLDGRFRLDKKNNLSYHVKTPLDRSENIPHQIKLNGEWALDDNHDLLLTLDKSGRETFGDKLAMRGRILAADKNSLLFAVTAKTKESATSTYTLNFEGAWKADENNRLTFRVNKENGRHDILILGGAWNINKDYEIVYEYEKAGLIRKRRKTHSITFKGGHWLIRDKFRVSYEWGGNTDSAFDFKALSRVFSKDRIKYELGIGLNSRKKPAKKSVTFFGKWRLTDNAELNFETEREKGKRRAITLGAEIKPGPKDTILARIKNDPESKGLSAELKFSREIAKSGGIAFLRLLKSKRESAFYAGMAHGW